MNKKTTNRNTSDISVQDGNSSQEIVNVYGSGPLPIGERSVTSTEDGCENRDPDC